MNHNSTLTRSRWLLLTLFTFFMAFSGASSVWADTLTENFNGTNLPDGWSLVGAVTHDDTRARSGKGVWTSEKSTSANYLITEAVEGEFEFYARAYNKSYASTVVVYEYTGSGLGTQLYTTGSMYTSSTPTWTRYSFNIANGTQLAIVLNYAAIDDVTYTQMEAIEGPALVVKDGSTKITTGYNYNFGLAVAGTEKTFTLTNPGTAAVEGLSVAETGSYNATLSATSIAAGGDATLTISMPSTTGNSEITISSTTEGIADFVINASGTVRNPQKVYLDFSDGQIPDGWTSVQTGSYSSNPWTAATGYIGTSGTSSSYTHAFTSPMLTFAKDEVVMFKTARCNNKDWYDDPYTSSIAVQYSTDGSEWTTIGSAFTDDLYGSWTQRSVTIPVEGVKYIRFNGYDVYLTEIYGGQEIARPKNVTITGISATAATIGWTAFGSEANWQVSYSTTSGDPANGTLVNANSNSKEVTGLSPITTYYVSVRIDNGGGNYGEWSDESSFTTKVGPISAYPYTESFNSLSSNGQIPEYWDNSEGTTTDDTYKWSYNSSYGTGHEGKCIRFDSYNNNNGKTNFLKTRPFNFTEGQPMKLSFWYKNPAGGDFSVYASTDGGTTYPTVLATALTGKSDWTQKEIDIPASVFGNNVVIVFKGTSNYGNGDARIYLDDVTISEVSAYAMSVSGGDVVSNTIAFGTVKNTTTTKTFTINNDGSGDLTGISVVSSDAEVFTVSDTGFDIAAGGSKDITVTFVKAVENDYNKTITISQTNIATPIVLTVTATYQTPTPATMDASLDDVAVGATVAFGAVNKSTVKTIKIANSGEATLNATIAITGTDASCFTLSTTSLEVAGGANETFTITFNSDDEDVAKTATVTLSAAGLSPVSFDVTGTYVNMWSQDFEGGAIPTGWDNSGFIVKQNGVGGYPSYDLPSYFAVGNGGSSDKTLITPLLKANAGDKLTFDGFFYYGDETMKVDYSTDLSTWNNLYTYDKSSYSNGSTHNIEIESAITGEFYLRFTVNYYNGIDNIVGFKLAPAKEHDAIIASNNIPAEGNQYVEYTATITVKEKAGKDDEVVTAELWIGTNKVATEENVTLTANDDKEITLSFTPATAMSGDAYIKVYNANIDLTTATQTVEINEALVLDETVDLSTVLSSIGVKPSVVVKYTAKNGWNTICMPFALTDEILTSIFGAGYKAYEFKSYSSGVLGFSSTTTFASCYPYIVYIEAAASNPEGVKLFNVNVTDDTAKYDEHSGVTFKGSFAPVADASTINSGSWYGVTTGGEIRPAGATATMDGFRAFFTGDVANARIFIMDDEDVTGIAAINREGLAIDNAAVYNLNGQKVLHAKKGVYIVNGRKVVIK